MGPLFLKGVGRQKVGHLRIRWVGESEIDRSGVEGEGAGKGWAIVRGGEGGEEWGGGGVRGGNRGWRQEGESKGFTKRGRRIE